MSAADAYLVRQFEPADVASMYTAVRASLPDLAEWMPWCTVNYAQEQAESWVAFAQQAWADRSQFPLAIVERASGAVVGGVGINQIGWAHRVGNIGYWVSAPHRGRGVARFAAQQAALLGFGELGLTRLEIVTLPHNTASQRVAESLGARREGMARNRLVVHGVAHDAVMYSLVPADVVGWGGEVR